MRAARLVSRLLQRYWRVSRGLTLAVAGLVLDEGGRILLARDGKAGAWRLPGGLATREDRASEALRRCLAEEACIAAGDAPRLLSLDTGFARVTGDHVAVFLVKGWQRLDDVGSRRRATETAFFPLDGLPSALAPGTRERVAHLRGRPPMDGAFTPSKSSPPPPHA